MKKPVILRVSLASVSLALMCAQSAEAQTTFPGTCAAIPLAAANSASPDPTPGGAVVRNPSFESDYTHCMTAPGYYLQTDAAGIFDGDDLVIAACPVDVYCPGGSSVYGGPVWNGVGTPTDTSKSCPTNSNTATNTGSDSLSDCVTDAGYMLATADASDPTAVVITAIPVNAGIYTIGGQAVTDVGNDFGSTSADFQAGTTGPTAADLLIVQAMQITPCPTATTNSAAAPSSASDCDVILCDEIPLSSTDDTTGGAIETTGSTNTGSADFSVCETAPGYYLHTVATAATAADGIRIEKAPAGWYAIGGEDVTAGQVEATAASSLTTMNGAAKIMKCPTNSNSAAGSDALNDCKVDPGYYLSSAGAGGASAGTITQVPAGKYFAGGTSVDAMSVDVPSSCPANSNSPAGSDALADCTCDAGYTLSGSSCVVDTAPPTSTPPTSAGATIPVVAAFAAMAMPLLV